MATGYDEPAIAAADWVDALKDELPDILRMLPSGWTESNLESKTRQAAYELVKRRLISFPQIPANDERYLDRIYDSSQLEDAEVYAGIMLIAEKLVRNEGDIFDFRRKLYEKKLSDFLENVNLKWDYSVEIDTEDTEISREKSYYRIRRV